MVYVDDLVTPHDITSGGDPEGATAMSKEREWVTTVKTLSSARTVAATELAHPSMKKGIQSPTASIAGSSPTKNSYRYGRKRRLPAVRELFVGLYWWMHYYEKRRHWYTFPDDPDAAL